MPQDDALMNPDRHDALIRKTYAAVGEQPLWPGLIAEWAEALTADSAMLFTPGNQFNRLPVIGHRIDFEQAKAYGEYFHLHDVWRFDAQKSRAFLPGTAILGEAAVSQGALHRTVFYNDFLRHMDHEWLMGSVLLPDQNRLGLPETALTLYRRPGRRAFGRDAVHALQRAAPHLQRSLMLHHELLQARAEKTLLQSALDQLGIGVVVLHADGRVRFVNRQAETVLRTHNLQPVNAPPVLPILQQLDRQARQGHYTGQRVETAQGPLFAMGTPGPRSVCSHLQTPAASAVVWLIGARHTGQGTLALAANLFRLTPAEQKVLSLLMQDQTPKAIAQSLGTELSTVRSQLSAILQKTGTRRQQELLRLMAAFPSG